MNCVFCKIISGELPAEIVYENAFVTAIRDLHPQAESHILLLPKEHIVNFFDPSAYTADASAVREALWMAIPQVLKAAGITEEAGFRLIQNNGSGAGQTVDHLHFHLISGKELGEKLV